MTPTRQPHSRRRTASTGRSLRVAAAVAALACAPPLLSAQFAGPALGLPNQPAASQASTVTPDLLAARSPDQRIIPGDVLTIRIYGSIDFSPIVKVGADGDVQLPLIGIVNLGGLSIPLAENAIALRLVAAGMYRHPSVSVQVTEFSSQFVTIEGEVKGSIVPVNGERRLLDILAIAGGLPPTASHVVHILRPGLDAPIVVDLGTDPARSAQANIAILPRDTILVSRVGVVYMLGAFLRQGAIPLEQNSPLTLMQASSLTGGVGFQGRFEDLRIIRTDGVERHFVKIDVKRVLRGQDPDPILQADDIVLLPTNVLKAALKNGGIATIVALTQVSLYAMQR